MATEIAVCATCRKELTREGKGWGLCPVHGAAGVILVSKEDDKPQSPFSILMCDRDHYRDTLLSLVGYCQGVSDREQVRQKAGEILAELRTRKLA